MASDTLIKASDRSNTLAYAISLLDKATAIDTNYFYAYQNKFLFQNELKQYANALITSKHLLNLRPKNVEIKVWGAEACERAGDSISAVKYYKSSLSTYNQILDTMSVKNPSYKVLEMEKATDLIMLNQPNEGYGMLKELYNNETNPNYKRMYQGLMNMTRHDFLYPEEKINVISEGPIKKS